jgi:D-sedoheptulose 7-phosphate isomerase
MMMMPTMPVGELVDRTMESYLKLFRELISALDRDAIVRVVELLCAARGAGRSVYVAGNGGSAATAAHFGNDLAKATRREGMPPFRAMCLSDNASWVTALANDEGYEHVFSGQLDHFARTGDVLVVISASGKSPNLVRAVELARERGTTAVALLGFDGGRLKELADEIVWVETKDGAYGPVETMHVLICDLIIAALIEEVA